MASINVSSIYSMVFILEGIPDLESSHVWISIPLFIMYVLAISGNLLMLLLIKMEPRLHNPMYYFLSTLSLTDLVISTSITLKMLSIFWFSHKEISFLSCLVQMFFIHCFTSLESGVLMAMAFDRYMAICNPLHYTSALTNTLIVKIVMSLVIRGTVIIAPCSWMASRLPYCRSHHVLHCYCHHMAVVKLACTDITINSAYGLTVVLSVIVFDVSSIVLSYIFILRAILRLSSATSKNKAFGTCTSHIIILVTFYTLGLFSFLAHRMGHTALYIHVIFSFTYLLIPPTINPIIYGVRTQEIRVAAHRLFTHSVT